MLTFYGSFGISISDIEVKNNTSIQLNTYVLHSPTTYTTVYVSDTVNLNSTHQNHKNNLDKDDHQYSKYDKDNK